MKKFNQAINKSEGYFGEYMVEYAQSEGFNAEQMCSGEWEPSEDTIKSAMADCINDWARLTGEELWECVGYWYSRDYN